MFEDYFLSPYDTTKSIPINLYIFMEFLDYSYNRTRNSYNRPPDSFDDFGKTITVGNRLRPKYGSYIYRDFVKTFKLMFNEN